MTSPIYLSTADLERIRPSAVELCDAIERIYRAKTPESVFAKPKTAIVAGAGHQFQSLCCAVRDPPYAVCKWVAVANSNSEVGLPTIHSHLLLTAFDTGEPLAIISAGHLTGIRTAATSMAAARRLANPDSRSIGFIGSGVQARAHLDLVAELFPSVRDVLVLSAARGSEALCKRIGALGMRARIVDEPSLILEEADLLVTSVPEKAGLQGFLDAGLVKPGAFVAAVDLGRSWIGSSLAAFSRIYTDDLEQSRLIQAQGKIALDAKFDGDLSDLANGSACTRSPKSSTGSCFLFPGFALSDLAVAVLYYAAAKRDGVGLSIDV